MPVSPIDLQALYAQTLNVGQEQSVMKESLVASQSAQGTVIARRTQENDESVPNSQDVGDGPENTDVDGKATGNSARSDGRNNRENQQVFLTIKDPQLGQLIDIVG